MFPNKDVTWNWHHKYVCGLLQNFILGDIDNLMIFMPPQHQKSTMMTEYLPAWLFGVNPNAEALLVMYNATMAAKYNRKIQRVIDNKLYKQIFPNTRLNDKNVVTTAKGSYVRNSEEFEIVGHRGFLKTTGVGGGIAGNPAKFTFMDDVIKNAAEANSKVYRDKIYDWQTDELEARQHNDSKIAFTITRRHDDDLAGRLIKRDGLIEDGGKWNVVRLPALKEDNNNANDPRLLGDALFPFLHSKVRMEEIRDTKPRTFASLYQQRPTSLQGELIKKNWFKHYELSDLPDGISHCYIDTAQSEKELKNNDPTGILVYQVYKNNLYLKYFIKGMWGITEQCNQIKWIAEKFLNGRRSEICIENKDNAKSVKNLLKNGTGLSIVLENIKGKKQERVANEEAVFESGRIYAPKNAHWWEDFELHCLGFPRMAHDEEVDCLTGAIRRGLGKKKSKYCIANLK